MWKKLRHEYGCGLYDTDACNLLTSVSLSDKNTGERVIVRFQLWHLQLSAEALSPENFNAQSVLICVDKVGQFQTDFTKIGSSYC